MPPADEYQKRVPSEEDFVGPYGHVSATALSMHFILSDIDVYTVCHRSIFSSSPVGVSACQHLSGEINVKQFVYAATTCINSRHVSQQLCSVRSAVQASRAHVSQLHTVHGTKSQIIAHQIRKTSKQNAVIEQQILILRPM